MISRAIHCYWKNVATDSHSSFTPHCDRCTQSQEEKVGSHLDILRPLKWAAWISLSKSQWNTVDKQYHKTRGLLCGRTLAYVKAITLKTEPPTSHSRLTRVGQTNTEPRCFMRTGWLEVTNSCNLPKSQGRCLLCRGAQRDFSAVAVSPDYYLKSWPSSVISSIAIKGHLTVHMVQVIEFI